MDLRTRKFRSFQFSKNNDNTANYKPARMKTRLQTGLFIVLLLTCPLLLSAQQIEAENAVLAGGAKEVSGPPQSGGLYVAQNNGTLTFYFNASQESFFNIYLNAAAASAGSKTNVLKSGDVSVNFTISSTSFEETRIVTGLKLPAGLNSIEIQKNAGMINIDYLKLEAITQSSRFNISPSLVTPDPDANAMKLYQFLKDTYGRKIISGVMTLNSMDMVNWLKTNTGKEPALVGLDFMHSGRNYDWYNDEEPVNDARAYYNRNGIPVFCWHWRDPSRNTEEFYTDKTNFDVSKVLDENSAEYAAMISDIDYIAGLLKILNDEHIPVLWRPLHEAAGGWFWWGAKGAAPCKKLYQIMWDRMVNHHGLKNLIWMWTREPNDDAWYPGDEYVDIVGRDLYRDGDHSSHFGEFSDMNGRYGQKKLITMSECGSFPDVDNLIRDGAGWLYYMPWYGKYTTESTYNSLTLWKKMFAHSYVITLNEMPDLKTYVAANHEPDPEPDPNIITANELSTEVNGLQVYPTIVTNNLITIKGKGVIGAVSIHNSQGKQVETYIIRADSATISVPAVPGLYYVKRVNGSETAKIIVK
jgi:mannan endo-1,4-beta-mannosidase